MFAACVFAADLLLQFDIAIGILYVAVVLISLWSPRRSFILAAASITSILTLLGFFLSPSNSVALLGITNRALIIFAIWVTAVLLLQTKRSEGATRKIDKQFDLAVRGANDGLWVWDLAENKIKYSTRWKAILGWEDHEIGDDPNEWFNRVHLEDIKHLRTQLDSHIEKHTPYFEHEHRILHKDGTYRWVLSRGLTVWDQNGKATSIAGSLTDITKRKQSEEIFWKSAIHDSLSGVFTRRFFMERLRMEVLTAKRYGYSLSLCICDLDHLKPVNDIHGHQVGDKVLSRFGRLIKNLLRTENIAGRYGGDEFYILFPHTPAEKAAVSIDRVRSHFEKVIFEGEGGKHFSMSATFGIADLMPHEKDEKELIESADRALLKAKKAGRNRIMINGRMAMPNKRSDL